MGSLHLGIRVLVDEAISDDKCGGSLHSTTVENLQIFRAALPILRPSKSFNSSTESSDSSAVIPFSSRKNNPSEAGSAFPKLCQVNPFKELGHSAFNVTIILSGMRSQVDVGVIDMKGRELRYFINVVDVHLSPKAGFYASRSMEVNGNYTLNSLLCVLETPSTLVVE